MLISDLFSVQNEIVIITGVSGQLGAKYARAFLKNGATVIGLDKQKSVLAIGLAKGNPEKFFFYDVDVSSKKSLQKVREKILNKIGTPTVLINNAAIDSPPSAPSDENGPFEEYPESSWDLVMDVNLKGVYLCCQVFGAEMAIRGSGSVINISSIYGMLSPDQNLYEYRRKKGEVFFKPIAYSVSKSGVLNLTRYLATYWAKKNVRVNSLTLSGVFNGQEEDFLKSYCGRIPIGRMANEEELIGAVIYLASKASTYVTGSNIVVDGGWSAI
jgi:NAD(P)-dependent dehydrogenase (short-subunit alcohol dehydrogenase family)